MPGHLTAACDRLRANSCWSFLVLSPLLPACTGHTVLLNAPQYTDNIPQVAAGFYGVHPVVGGVASEEAGSQFLGDVVYLYKDEFFVDGAYFSGIRGSFLPHHYIKTELVGGRNAYYWVDGHDDNIRGEIQFQGIGQTRWTAVVTDDKNQREEVELRFHGHQLSKDPLRVVPIAHRGLCYQPPNNYDGIYPANTMPGFEAALASGYKGFEFDVRITKDRRFVVSHDEDLSAATTSHGHVRGKTLSSLSTTLVIKSAFVPEKKSTAYEAYVAAPISPLKNVLDQYIDDPRLQTMVIDIKPDAVGTIREAARHDFEGLTEVRQRKLLFLVRDEGTAGVFKELCPHSGIGLEGSIGPEPVEDLEKFYPEAVGLPRASHTVISFGANIVLAAKSIESSLETIQKAIELARQHRYKIMLWTFAKEWRLDFLREHELFSDYILLDIPYYQYALQQMRFAKEKAWSMSGQSIPAREYSNPLYERVYNSYVADFWYESGTLAEVTYGQGTPSHRDVTSGFGPVGILEFKLGRTELNKFSRTNASLNEWYLSFSYASSSASLSGAGSNELGSRWNRFGVGRTEGFGYYGATVSFLPCISQSLMLTRFDDFGYGQNGEQGGMPPSDQQVLERYPGAYRWGDRVLYGLKAELFTSFQVAASFETGVVYPRFVFLPWMGSFILAQAGYGAMDYALGKIVDDYPFVGPILSMVVRSGYLYGFYLLRRNNMNWPFDSEAPLMYEVFNLGVSVDF